MPATSEAAIRREDLPMDPAAARALFREGRWTGPTTGIWIDFVNANFVAVPRDLAFDFLLFCQRNPRPCPLLEVIEAGSATVRDLAPGADVRTDMPRYCVYQRGVLVEQPTDVRRWWRDDLVSFLFGCSATFERGLEKVGIEPVWRQGGRRTPVYVTTVDCAPAGRLSGKLAVTMRPIPHDRIADAAVATARFPRHHGAPVQVGSPEALGIEDLTKPDWGGPVHLPPGTVPVFWACGVTPQVVALDSKPELLISHAPGHLFIADGAADADAYR